MTNRYLRMQNFIHNGTVCKHCGDKGLHYKLCYEQDKYPCLKFVTKNNSYLTLDHIRPVTKGGSYYNLTNHQTLCYECNQEKDNK